MGRKAAQCSNCKKKSTKLLMVLFEGEYYLCETCIETAWLALFKRKLKDLDD